MRDRYLGERVVGRAHLEGRADRTDRHVVNGLMAHVQTGEETGEETMPTLNAEVKPTILIESCPDDAHCPACGRHPAECHKMPCLVCETAKHVGVLAVLEWMRASGMEARVVVMCPESQYVH